MRLPVLQRSVTIDGVLPIKSSRAWHYLHVHCQQEKYVVHIDLSDESVLLASYGYIILFYHGFYWDV